MSGESLYPSLLAVGAILLGAACAGWVLCSWFFPGGRAWSLERWGWSVGLASLLLAFNVCLAFTLGLRPGWISFSSLATCGGVLAIRFRLPRQDTSAQEAVRWSPVSWLLLAITAAGVLIYFTRSLSEPMWSNDFLAVWGLKGKTVFGEVGIPLRLFRRPEFEFSNPGYPIGLPLVYAGVAFLLGRWDDHAMALLFPFLQVGTLLVLIGWLRRRGVETPVALGGAALVANFGLLYSALLTGMAEVPASFAFLLVGTALCDALDDTDRGCLRRLALASLLAAATKNEGVFLIATALAFLLVRAVRIGDRQTRKAAAAVLIPGLASLALHRLVLGGHPVRGLDLRLLWLPGLGHRIAETLREELGQLVLPAWPALVALGVLAALVCRSRRAAASPMLFLAAVSLGTYLALPVLCPLGPGWLVHWTVGRLATALFPLVVAGIGFCASTPPGVHGRTKGPGEPLAMAAGDGGR